MNTVLSECYKGFLCSINNVQRTFVRHRYYADKIARGEIIKNHGYVDPLPRKGHFPRLTNVSKLPMPEYRPANAWSEKKAYSGQNDYIDILGNGRLRPSQVNYHIPFWLRGVKGSEMRLLILKKNMFCHGEYPHRFPTAWENLNKRIRYLYSYMNRKTRTSFMKH